MITFAFIFYLCAVVVFALDIALLAYRMRKEGENFLVYFFFLFALCFFMLSAILNSLEGFLRFTVAQGIAATIGVVFTFCAALIMYHLKKEQP